LITEQGDMNIRKVIVAGVAMISLHAHAAITGSIFRDYNFNGARDAFSGTGAGSLEPGVGGITLRLYDSAGAVVSTTVSATLADCLAGAGAPTTDTCTRGTAPLSEGSYSLTASGTGPWRVEMDATTLPIFLVQSARGTSGSFNATSVQFVVNAAAVANFAVINAGADFCSGIGAANADNPTLITCTMRQGFQGTGGANATSPSVTSFKWNYPDRASAANAADRVDVKATATTGTIFGVAYKRDTKEYFVSSFMKRGAGFGPGGIGAIYKVSPGPDGLPGTSDDVVTQFSLSGTNTSGGVFNAAAVGTDTHPTTDGGNWAADCATPACDAADRQSNFDGVGKKAFGDLEISDDGATLYTITLANRELVRINAITGAVIDSTVLPFASLVGAGAGQCPTVDDLRPFAVKVQDAKVYVGVTCTAQSTASAANPATAVPVNGYGDRTKLRAYVLQTNLVPGAFTTVLNVPLDFARGTDGDGSKTDFNAWIAASPGAATTLKLGQTTTSPLIVWYPQPWLTGIEFDRGDMVLGLRDRAGDQGGPRATTTATGNTQQVTTIAQGQYLRACRSTIGWDLEANGSCGGLTGQANQAAAGLNANGQTDYDQAQGPGGGEFYWRDERIQAATLRTFNNGHQHVGLGASVQWAGKPQSVMSMMDPSGLWSAGFRNLYSVGGGSTGDDPLVGDSEKQFNLYTGNGFTGETNVFAKANGLGDVELLCDAAPVEIGNRVWNDANGNGVQDPAEAAIGGVTVNLYDATGNLVGTTTTAADGTYYFGGVAGAGMSATNVLSPVTVYSIRLDNPSDYTGAGPLAGLALTLENRPDTAGGRSALATNNAATDVFDSDAVNFTNPAGSPAGIWPAVAVTTGDAGSVNHGLDFGFTPTFSLGNRVWLDANNNGLVDAAESGVDGVGVELLVETAPGSGVYAPTATPTIVTTANGGYYRFDGLPAGNYKVRVNASNFAVAGPLSGYFTSGTPVADPNTDTNNDNNGIAPTGAGVDTYVQAGVSSGPITLGGATTEPTNDSTEASGTAAYNATNSNGTAAADAQSNLSVDFGFHKVSIGNRLWLDNGGGTPANADNGIADAGELPVADGTIVNLVDASGTVIATTTTVGGLYMFMTDTAGNPLLLSGSPADVAKQFRVVVPTPPTGTVSSTPTETTLTATGNDKDHGAPGTGTAVQTELFTLAPGAATNGQTISAAAVTDQPQLDMGFAPAPTYSLGNRIWFDADNSGTVNGSELGTDGVVVELLAETAPGSGVYAATGTTLTTANGGYYRFDGLAPGNYKVRVNASNFAAAGPLSGYFTSGTPTVNADGDVNNDNNGIAPAGGDYVGQGVSSGPVALGGSTPEPSNDITEAGTVGANTYNATNSNGTDAPDARGNLTVDFGFHKVSIGNRVWLDTGAGSNTNNGIFDAGEAPVADGTSVTLVDALGNIIATTTTVGGTYMFMTDSAGNPLLSSGSPTDLAKQFRVVITPPIGLASSTPTSPVAAGNDERDHGTPTATGGNIQSPNFSFSNLGTTTNGQVPTATTATTVQPQIDFGLVPAFSLGNRVWFDSDNSGTVNGIEAGVDGVVVELLAETAPGSGVFTPTGTTLTTANGGFYRFDGLGAGNYKVRVNPSNFGAAGPLRGYFTSGTPEANANGDANNDNNGVAPTGGDYVGLGVTSGTITLGGAIPEPTNDTTEVSGTAAYNATNSNGTAAPDSQSNLSVDFGFHKVSIGNQLWFDTGTGANTNNGVFDAGESPLPDGVVVNLVDAAGNTVATTTTTGGTGTYMFMTDTAGNPLLVSGSPTDIAKQFRVVVPTPPAGAVSSAPTETTLSPAGDNKDHGAPGTGTAVQTALFTLTPGAVSNGQTTVTASATTNQPQLDMGFVTQFSIGNRVWLDTDNSGTINNAEQGKDGVVVNLLNGLGQPLYRQADGSIGTTVTATPITTTTSGGGYYRFDGLPPGQYTVQLAPVNFAPGGMLFSATTNLPLPVSTGPGANGNDGVDSNSNALADPNPATNGIRSNVVTLGDGAGEPTGETDLGTGAQGSPDNRADMTIDFGFVPLTFALGNIVFVDANNNGIKDASETGIGAGVTVELFADANSDGVPDGVAIAATSTNASGQYLFSGLPEGKYIVQISGAPLAGYASSTGINGSTTGPYEPGSSDFTAPGNDRDHGSTVSPGVIRSGTIMLGTNTPTGEGADLTVTDPNATPDNRTNLTVDFGVFRPASIGTVVWIDNGANAGVSGDGIKQPGEAGISGVVVRLLDASGNPVDGDPATPGVQPVTTVTGTNGEYSFTNLIPGQYQVEFVFPTGSTVTTTANPPGSGSPAVGIDSQRNEMNPTTRRTPVITLAAGQDNPNLDSGVLAFSNTPKEIPMLNQWMLMLLALMMFGVTALMWRRR
jgi:SdrD B-like domain